jgi:hypothetical protein
MSTADKVAPAKAGGFLPKDGLLRKFRLKSPAKLGLFRRLTNDGND